MALISLVVSILALFLSVVAVMASVWIFKKTILHSSELHEDLKRNQRIEGVVAKYNELLTSNRSSDLHGLIEAGIATLDEDEMKEAIKRVSNLQRQRNPLHHRREDIERIGLERFFKNITLRQSKSGELDEVIDRLLNSK